MPTADQYLERGCRLVKLHLWERAITCLTCGLQLDPKNVAALIARANCYINTDQCGPASEDAEQIIELLADGQAGYLIRARIMAREGYSTADCLKAFCEAIAKDPANPEGWVDRGYIYLREGKPEEALKEFDHALICSKTCASALMARGEALEDLCRPEDAVRSYQEYLVYSNGELKSNILGVVSRIRRLEKMLREGDSSAQPVEVDDCDPHRL